MLDRKTKDVDASIELLEGRQKRSKYAFFIFFIVGWSVTWLSALLMPLKYDEVGIGIGIALLVFATWFFINWWCYDILMKIEKNKKEG